MTQQKESVVTPERFASGMTWEQYLEHIKRNQGKFEYNHSETVLTDEDVEAFRSLASAADGAAKVLALGEDWCPDVIRHVPVLQKMTEHTEKLHIRYISRIDHPDIFARYWTVGGEAIPKFVYFNDQFVECGVWGPMPHACREMIARGRACDDLGKAREHVFAAYYDDPDRLTVINEVIQDIRIAACQGVPEDLTKGGGIRTQRRLHPVRQGTGGEAVEFLDDARARPVKLDVLIEYDVYA